MWSRSVILAVCAGPLTGGVAAATQSGRLDLLAREAAEAVPPAVAAAPGGALGFFGAVLLSAVLASILGTWIGLRSRSVTQIRERNGWRELSYRFRSPDPLKADANLIGRLAGVLDDLEDLGRRLRPVGAPSSGISGLAGTSGASGASGATGATLAAEDLRAPVRFRRAEEAAGVRARWSPGPTSSPVAPVAPPRPRSEVPVPAATPSRRTPTPAAVTAALASPVAPPAPRGEPIVRDRAGTYREARRLLQEGHDRRAVRERTGLKLAEIDLLRCAPGDGS